MRIVYAKAGAVSTPKRRIRLQNEFFGRGGTGEKQTCQKAAPLSGAALWQMKEDENQRRKENYERKPRKRFCLLSENACQSRTLETTSQRPAS